MLPDIVDSLSEEQKRLYISLLAAICSADGELVREEMAALEQAMGSALLHPESREQMRQLLANDARIDDLLLLLDQTTARLVLRDGFLIAACDGDYDERELEILTRVHKISGLDENVVAEIIAWVAEKWELDARGRGLISAKTLGDETLLKK